MKTNYFSLLLASLVFVTKFMIIIAQNSSNTTKIDRDEN